MSETQEEESDGSSKTRCDRFKEWFGGASCCIYINFVLGAWGDRMWLFASGLYLVALADGLLRLAAVLGFAGGGCILLLGGVIGNWVDENPRLMVVRVCLFVQNMSVALCAVSVCLTLYYTEYIHEVEGGNLRYLSEGLIVCLAIIASLASLAYKIAIQKDWVVVLADNDKAYLANLNATMRAIDLTCKLLAPLTVGVIMTYASLLTSAVVIAGWNVVSVAVEYSLLARVYRLMPRLAVKGEGDEEESGVEPAVDKSEQEHLNKDLPLTEDPTNTPSEKERLSSPSKHEQAIDVSATTTPKKQGCVHTMLRPFVTFVRGWKTYARQRVVFAGLALAFLYMTVLGLDSVTTGFIYANGVSEAWVGVTMGLSGLSGVFGTFLFTVLRKRNGLERTGLLAFNLEILCLTLCVASVWAPGSPFDPTFKITGIGLNNVAKSQTNNCSLYLESPLGVEQNITSDYSASVSKNRTKRAAGLEELDLRFEGGLESRVFLEDMYFIAERKRRDIGNATVFSLDIEEDNKSNRIIDNCEPKDTGLNVSVMLLIIGIITSRVGLWMADLVISQLQQENVPEKERGIVNGVQVSLNMFMEMFKYLIVIILPFIQTYGYLVLMSFGFIVAGGMFYAYYSWTVRGHLFHFEKICHGSCGNGHVIGNGNMGGGVVTGTEEVQLKGRQDENVVAV